MSLAAFSSHGEKVTRSHGRNVFWGQQLRLGVLTGAGSTQLSACRLSVRILIGLDIPTVSFQPRASLCFSVDTCASKSRLLCGTLRDHGQQYLPH